MDEARMKAELIAEALAKDACEMTSDMYGWDMRYERRGDSFIIFTDGVPTNEIEIVALQWPTPTKRISMDERIKELAEEAAHSYHLDWTGAPPITAYVERALRKLQERHEQSMTGITNAWKRDYEGEKARADAWMADCKQAEAALRESHDIPCPYCGKKRETV